MSLRTLFLRNPRTLAARLTVIALVVVHLESALAQSMVDSTTEGIMNGFELSEAGLYWWNDGFAGNDIDPVRIGQIATLPVVARNAYSMDSTSSKTYVALRTIELRARNQSVGRDAQHMYYFRNSAIGLRFMKRALYGTDSPENDYSGVSYSEAGAIIVSGPTVYWGARGGAAADNGEVRRKSISAFPGGGEDILASGVGLIKKMKVVETVDVNGGHFGQYLFMLNTADQLWSIRLSSILNPFPGAPALFASGVSDFDVRTESSRPVFPGPAVYGTMLYAAMGSMFAVTPGRLEKHNLTESGSTTEYNTSNANVQVTGVALDDERIFITTTPLVAGIYNLSAGQILRRQAAAHTTFPLFTTYETIALNQEGRNLRSDTQWLYYAHQNQIRRLKTETPEKELDYRAVGLEVVQAVQDSNNSIPLVAGKPAIVRGYAQLVKKSAGVKNFQPTARLRAFRNGLPLGETHAENHPLIDGIDILPILRADKDRSFIFQVPSGWLEQPGSLVFEFMVNASGAVPETGATPFANNKATATVQVVPGRTPTLVFKQMSSTVGTYDPQARNSGFGDILARARSLLPVSDFNVRVSPGVVYKPVITLLPPFVVMRSFSMPDDATWALIWLTRAHAFSDDPPGSTDTHWVGMFPSEVGTWNGIGGCRGVSLSDILPNTPIDISFPRTAFDNTSCVRMNGGFGTSTAPWSLFAGGYTLAHELSHNYGRFHIDQSHSISGCPGGNPARPWHVFPGDACTLGSLTEFNARAPMGFDPLTYSVIQPTDAGDIMTYAHSRWTSPFTWNALVGAIPPDQQAAPTSSLHDAALMVQGVINTVDQSAAILPLVRVPANSLDARKVNESLAAAQSLTESAPYRLRLLNSAGTILDDRALVPIASAGAGESGDGVIHFAQAIPDVPGASRLQVIEGARLLVESTASANAPQLALDTPVIDAMARTLELRWKASDPDGDVLMFIAQFSADDGATWQTLTLDDFSLGIAVSTALLPGGNACRVRVLATDGFHTTIATTSPFNLPKYGPSISISGIHDQQKIVFNSNVVARAFAYDAEDGAINPSTIQWSVTGPETHLGVGETFSLKGLAPGKHMLTATAQDSDGAAGVATLQFEVGPIVVPDGVAPELDGITSDTGYTAATEVRLDARQGPTARFVHADGYLYVAVGGLPYSDSGSPPASLGFYLNADAMSNSTPQMNDLHFALNEDGVSILSRGNGLYFEPEGPLGIEARILRSLESWSAELRVPESALAGWNHDARIAFSVDQSPPKTVVKKWPANAVLSNPGSWAPIHFGTPPVPVDRPPVAVASAPGAVSFSSAQMVTLDGSASYDLDSDPLTFAWIQIAGPTVTLDDADSATPSFQTPTLTTTATVSFQLVVNDGTSASAPANVSIVLAPMQTTASASGPMNPVGFNSESGSASVNLQWPGGPASLATIQVSEDLVNWETIATNSANYLGMLVHSDAQAKARPRRFYRAVSAPPIPISTWAELEFDGTDDSVDVPHASQFNSLPFSVTAWFRTTQSGASLSSIIAKYEAAATRGYIVGIQQGRLYCSYAVDATRFAENGGVPGPIVADGQWHHVAYVVETTGARVYLDGSLVNTQGWSGSPGAITTTTPLRFAAQQSALPGTFFRGNLDEVALWNRALGAAEINQMIPGKLAGTEPGLIGFWPMDEANGSTAQDATFHGHDGTLQNGPAWSESTAPLRGNLIAGSALRFDGVDDAVRVAHQSALNAFPLTIAAWIKTAQNSSGYVSVANKYLAGSGNGYSLHIRSGRLFGFYFRGNGTDRVSAGDSGVDGGFIADGRWHHVAFVVDENGGRLYVDGAQTGSLGWTGTPGACTTTTLLQFGFYPLGGQALSLDGRLDELTLWNRALDVSEINALRNFKQKGTESGLIGYWPLDNGVGLTGTDTTGHGHDGTLQNDPVWVSSDAPVAH